MSKLLTTLACALLGITPIYAQQYSTNKVELYQNDAPIPMADWQVYHQTPEFKIEYVKADCDPSSGLDFEAVHMRFTNLTNQDIKLSWHIDLDYDGACKTCGSNEYLRTLEIPANQTISTGCESDDNRKYRLFSKFIDQVYSKGAHLTAFKLSDLELENLNPN